ncbi:MAG TPA: M28 family peptidase, partial [Candidatus Limnocylindria bacterium]|nr:M28 family peptidase [Candidatus Limnocylindria bacterium]
MNPFQPLAARLTVVHLALIATVAGAELPGSAASPSAASLLARTAKLASDEFEGRGPGTHGEAMTTAWLVEQFQAMGLKPGNPNGSWFQDVPMAGMRSVTQFQLRHAGTNESLTFPQDFVAWAPPQRDRVTLTNSELVFVGYGVVAPEYGWDDFKDVDVRGKTVVFLVNDPPIPDPHDPAKLDEAMFKGKAMTYYGRWTYKFEIAAKKGAAAALIIHETKPAAYPWFVVVNSWGRERFDLDANPEPQVEIAAWLSLERARKLFADAGTSYEAVKQAALRRDFRPQPLGFTADFDVTNTIRHVRSRNVVAKVEGRDPKLRDEWLIYTAHWDHLGRDEKLTGDQIFNGAADNAIGTAGLLELAGAFAHAPEPPKRSVLFLAVTAEEQGLLGAKYYASQPLYPLNRTLANINMDGLNT